MANASTLVGTPVSTAVASAPDLCRISGYLKDLHGNPLPGVGLMFVNTYNPLGIATNTLLLQERTTVRSDKNGYVEFDLIFPVKGCTGLRRGSCILPGKEFINGFTYHQFLGSIDNLLLWKFSELIFIRSNIEIHTPHEIFSSHNVS